MERKIRVMLVEDHPEYREVVEIAVAKEPDMELAGTFGAAQVALQRLQDDDGCEQPDIILLDLNLPVMSGLDAIPLFTAAAADAKIIIVTQSANESDVLRAISLGASGYLLKSSTVKQITEGIRAVMSGDAPLDFSVARFILGKLRSVLSETELAEGLTKREIEILSFLGEGLSKKEIAKQLGISSHTVRTHVVHIYEKLNVQNAPAAITKAYRLGIFRS